MAPSHGHLPFVAVRGHGPPVHHAAHAVAALHQAGPHLEPSPGLVGLRPSAGQRVGRVQHLDAEHVAAGSVGHVTVDHRGHVDVHAGPLRHPALGPQLVGLDQLVGAGQDRQGGAAGVQAAVEALDPRSDAVAGRGRQHRVDLGLVALPGPAPLPAPGQPQSRGRGAVEPFDQHRPGIAGRHHRWRRQLGAVGEAHACRPAVAHQQPLHRGAAADPAPGRLETGPDGVGEGAAAAPGPAQLHQVPVGVGQCSQPGAGGVGPHPPHGGSGGDRGHGQVPIVEVPGQNVEDAGPAPGHEPAGGPGPSPPGAGQEAAGRGRYPGHLQSQLGHIHGVGQVPAVGADLAGMGAGQAVQHPLGLMEEDHRLGAVIEGADPAGLRLEVFQPVVGQLQFVGDGHGPDQGVVAVADVEPDPEVLDGGRAAPHVVLGLHHQRVEAGSGQVGGADQPVVPPARHDHIRIAHGRTLLWAVTYNARAVRFTSRRSIVGG